MLLLPLLKLCTKCKTNKPYIEFSILIRAKDGYNHQCRLCWKKYKKIYHCNNIIKLKQTRKKYRIKNADKIKQQTRQYYIDNTDKIIQYGKQWNIDNHEYFKQSKKKYRQTPQGKLVRKSTNHKRRALIRNNTPVGKHWKPDDIVVKLKLQNYKCIYCQNSIKDYHEVEHFLPLCKGGSNEPSNIQLLCQECNRGKDGKGTKMPHEFAKKFNMLF